MGLQKPLPKSRVDGCSDDPPWTRARIRALADTTNTPFALVTSPEEARKGAAAGNVDGVYHPCYHPLSPLFHWMGCTAAVCDTSPTCQPRVHTPTSLSSCQCNTRLLSHDVTEGREGWLRRDWERGGLRASPPLLAHGAARCPAAWRGPGISFLSSRPCARSASC